MHSVMVSVAALSLAVSTVPADPASPTLDGIPLEDGSDLSLLGIGEVIDVDTGAHRPIEGLSPVEDSGWWAFQHGHHVVIQMDCHDCGSRPDVFCLQP